MKAILNNRGIQEIEEIYPAYVLNHVYLKKEGRRRYHFSALFIPELNIYSTYFYQDRWLPFEGGIFDSKSEEEVDLSKKKVLQNYTVFNGDVVSADEVEYIGEVFFDSTISYRNRLHAGKYSVYSHHEGLAIVDLGTTQEIFERFDYGDFEYFEVEPDINVCWHVKDGIENAFLSKNADEDLAKDYRKAKICSLL
ncbi:MAG: hypothetical protein DSY77_13425 [Bacteroidetes bacterium]|nr:MAG: hypothetical protein DSY77_13425 [Bacteroidota bacterium]